jgi:hypothetical protein
MVMMSLLTILSFIEIRSSKETTICQALVGHQIVQCRIERDRAKPVRSETFVYGGNLDIGPAK